MIAVVDSGASKADWIITDGHTSQDIHTIGFSPIFQTSEFIATEVQKAFSDSPFLSKIHTVYYYGTGCWDAKRKGIVSDALQQVFVGAQIHVEHDLLGAARAVCGDQAGIACIIGTGSNTCLYDGQHITDNITNLGYFLGDEGSGACLGKMLIQSYFYRELPDDLLEAFEVFVPGGESEILDKVYGTSAPSVYLATFMSFMAEQRQHFYIQKLIYDAFSVFIDRHVRKYDNHIKLPVHFIGSVAYHFQDIMKIVLEERSMKPGNFLQKPINSLAEFHKASKNKIYLVS